MEKDNILINRVANSSLKVFNLENYYPSQEVVDFDLKPFLFKELILKEKDFRSSLKELDWEQFKDKIVLVYNSNDAIIPVWAYMLVSSYLESISYKTFLADRTEFLNIYYSETLKKLDLSEYQDQRVVIKGCSNKPVPPSAYALLTSLLKPFAQSIMYGEPCSTVPIFKRPRKFK